MSDLLGKFVEEAIAITLKKDYPHVLKPDLVLAKITESKREEAGLTVTIKILDKEKMPDEDYPVIPYVRTEKDVVVGDTVVVALLYGSCLSYILGRWIE